MKTSLYSLLILITGVFACSDGSDNSISPPSPIILEDAIFKYRDDGTDRPYGMRLGYYYDNGKEFRWMDIDREQNLETDYIAQYDSNWIQTGALYTEPGDDQYYKEIVSWPNDSTKVTEWVDSAGAVYYTMTDYLNSDGKTKAAQFKGDEVHGYDTTEYNADGFVSRIFFTNSNGQVRNDRAYIYDSIDQFGNWAERRVIRSDTTYEMQRRTIRYQDSIYPFKVRFQLGIISLPWEEENCVSITDDTRKVFLTRAIDWDQQQPLLFTKHHGQYAIVDSLQQLGTIKMNRLFL